MRELLGSAWLEINLDAVKFNMQSIKSWIGEKIQIMGVVKGNGYGHDAVEIANIILEYGATQLAVARIEEAIVLRKNNIKAPILVLGVALDEQFKCYLDYQIMPTISDLKSAYKFNKIASGISQKIKVHLKIETGMGRLGFKASEIMKVITELKKLSNIEIEGIYTHFSTADEKDKEYTLYQFHLFKEVMNKVKKSNLKIPYYHTANSGAILDLPETWLDMVRPGCLIYGLYPSGEVNKSINLLPALSFKSRISFLKRVAADSFIGYGRTYKTKKETVVATLPVGYADGYSRLLSNSGQVLLRGEIAPVVGRVCMDQMMIDISNIANASVGDEIVLWGEQRGKYITVEEIAKKLNTIVDEVVHLTDKARVAKLFIKEGKPWKIKNILGEYNFGEIR